MRDYGLRNGLAPILEREEPRSADPVRDTGMKYKDPINYQYRMKNEAKGYKENLPPINKYNDNKSYL